MSSKRWQQENRERFAAYMRDYRAGKRVGGQHGKTKRVAIQYRKDQVARWICYCVGEGGVVNVEPQCSKCRHVPTWAKAG